MSKKHSLPESLELLLDTMCNTFGGIMFIAISLVVISQFVARDIKTRTPEDINKEEIARCERNIANLRNDIIKLKQQALDASFNVSDLSPEKSAALKKLHAAARENLVLQEKLDKTHHNSTVTAARLRKSQQECRDAAGSVSKERQLQRRESMKLEAVKRQNSRQINRLQRDLQAVVPKTFTFAAEAVTSLRPYWIIIHRNRVYRMNNSDECERVATGERSFRIVPKQSGIPVEKEGDAAMARIFGAVDQSSYFVSMVSDEESFAALKQLRYYLRKKGFKVYWAVDGQYRFTFGASSYSASE